MVDAGRIHERMEIVSSDDRHVGNVEHVLSGEIVVGRLRPAQRPGPGSAVPVKTLQSQLKFYVPRILEDALDLAGLDRARTFDLATGDPHAR